MYPSICSVGLCFLIEPIFRCAADGAYPILRQLLKGSTRLYSIRWVALGGVVYVAADAALVFVHEIRSVKEAFKEESLKKGL